MRVLKGFVLIGKLVTIGLREKVAIDKIDRKVKR